MTLALLSWGCGLFPNPGNVQSPRIFKIMGNMSRLTSDALLGFADFSLVNFWVTFYIFYYCWGGMLLEHLSVHHCWGGAIKSKGRSAKSIARSD